MLVGGGEDFVDVHAEGEAREGNSGERELLCRGLDLELGCKWRELKIRGREFTIGAPLSLALSISGTVD